MPDFEFVNHGSICLLTPVSEAACEWIDEHLPEDATRWGQCSIVIEPRYANDILAGIFNDGLSL
jgi:hypothetical protein